MSASPPAARRTSEAVALHWLDQRARQVVARTIERVFEPPSRRPLDRVPMRDAAHEAPAGARRSERMTQPEMPIPVRVWITNARGEHHLDGEAIAWTRRQVRVHYLDEVGREGWAWVWAAAVERRD